MLLRNSTRESMVTTPHRTDSDGQRWRGRSPEQGNQLYDQAHVHSLRSLADCRAIIAQAQAARTAIILGVSFIGLEVAAALRSRGLEVHLVAPEKRPLERIFGQEMGEFIQLLHEERGVVFHLNEAAISIDGNQVKLKGVAPSKEISSLRASGCALALNLP